MVTRIALALNVYLIVLMITTPICFADEAVDQFRMTRVKVRGEAFLEEARREIENGAYYRGIRLLSQAISKGVSGVEVYELRARAYEGLGAKDLALADLNTIVATRHSEPSAYVIRGDALNSLKHYDQAVSDYNRSVELDPFYVDAYLGRGSVYAAMEKYELAIRDFELALKIDQHNPEALYNMAVICMMAGLPKAGRDFTHRALEVNQDPADRERLFSVIAAMPERSDYEEKKGGVKGIFAEVARQEDLSSVTPDQTKSDDSEKSHRRTETRQALAKIGKEDFSGTSSGIYMGIKWSVSYRVTGKATTGTLKIVTPSGKEEIHHGRGTFDNGEVEASDNVGFRFKGKITDDLKLVGSMTTADGQSIPVNIPLDF